MVHQLLGWRHASESCLTCLNLPVVDVDQMKLNHLLSWNHGRLTPRSSFLSISSLADRLVGLVVKVPASRTVDLGFDSCFRREDFSGSSHTSDFNIGTPVATLPGAWHYEVSAGTGWPGFSILWQGEVESNFYLSVAAHKLVWADPPPKYSSMLLGR